MPNHIKLTDQVILQTPRLELRGLAPQHIHELFNRFSKTEVMDYLGIEAEADYLHYLEMHTKGMENHRLSLFVFILVEIATNRPIGECGFHTWNNKHNRAELFYLLRNDVNKQKGFMTEALKTIIPFGFNQMKLHRIAAFVASWNIPSVKILNNFNFTKEGTMRQDYNHQGKQEDSDCFSLLKHEWETTHMLF